MGSEGQLDPESETPGVEAPTLVSAKPPGSPRKTLYKPVASFGKRQDTPPPVLSFLDRPPARPPPSQIEPHQRIPAQLTCARPSELGAMEHRVDESVARVPKWMKNASEAPRDLRTFDLEAAPLEEGVAGGGQEAEHPRGAGLPKQSGPPLGKGSLPVWLTPPERPRRQRSFGMGEGALTLDKNGEGGAGLQGEKAAVVDARMERQRMLARERRQKIENRKERINQQRASELESRKARPKESQTDGSEKETEHGPLTGSQLFPPFGVSPLPKEDCSQPASEQLEHILMRARGAGPATSGGVGAGSSSEAAGSPTGNVNSVAPLMTEEERQAMEQTKLVIERILQERAVFSAAEGPLFAPLQRTPGVSTSSPLARSTDASLLLWREAAYGAQMGGPVSGAPELGRDPQRAERFPAFGVDFLGVARPTDVHQGGTGPRVDPGGAWPTAEPSLASFRELPTGLWPPEDASRKFRVGSRPTGHSPSAQTPEKGGELDLSLHLGLPNQPPVSPAAPQPISLENQQFPPEVEAAMRAHFERARASGARLALEEGGAVRHEDGASLGGASSTNNGRETPDRTSRDQSLVPPLVTELRRESGGKRRERPVPVPVDEARSAPSRVVADSPPGGGRRWLSAAAAEIEVSVLAELQGDKPHEEGRQHGPASNRKKRK